MGTRNRKRTVYSKSFRERAIRLSLASSRPVSQVARELNISDKTLHSWVRSARLEKSSKPGQVPAPSEANEDESTDALRTEVLELRRRCAVLRETLRTLAREDAL